MDNAAANARASCQTNPAACGIQVMTSCAPSAAASYDSTNQLLEIPLLEVSDPFRESAGYHVIMRLTDPSPVTFRLEQATPLDP